MGSDDRKLSQSKVKASYRLETLPQVNPHFSVINATAVTDLISLLSPIMLAAIAKVVLVERMFWVQLELPLRAY